MSLSSKHWKQQEFVAHGANVTCLALGHKSGRVMATGGDDKKVNLWAIGNPSCVMSISSGATSVECVRFDPKEVMICTGSLSGALKVCDLEVAKVIRTLTGHKAGIRCLDFHPFGDYIISGSLDTNIKLWDTRNKGCVYTYKGHNKAVNTIKFSPDGKWVASGAEDGSVKLWDVSAGKLLTEFHGHTSSLSGVEFHPNEFLLASGSSDRTVKFWDLESFQLVSTSVGDGPPVRCISFHSSGLCMFAGSQDVLKVYGWEPPTTYDTVLTGWGKVSDVTLSKNELIGGSFSLNSVVVHSVQLEAIKPFCKTDNISYIPNHCINSISSFGTSRVRKSFEKDYGNRKLRSLEMQVSANQDFDAENDNLGFNEVEDGQVFIPKSEICRTPPKEDSFPFDAPLSQETSLITLRKQTQTLSLNSAYSSSANSSPQDMPPTRTFNSTPPRITSPTRTPSTTIFCTQATTNQSRTTNPATISSSVQTRTTATEPFSQATTEPFLRNKVVAEPFSKVTTEPFLRNKVTAEHFPSKVLTPEPFIQPFPKGKSSTPIKKPNEKTTWSAYPPGAVSVVRPTFTPPAGSKDAARVRPVSVRPEYVPEQRDKPAGLNVDDFLPKSMLQQGLNSSRFPQTEISEVEAMEGICREHQPFRMVYDSRAKKLHIVLAVMKAKGPKIAAETAVSMNDPSILVDFVSVLNHRQDLWTLDLCQIMLPSVQDILQSNYESYMSTGCSSVKLILQKFGNLIKSNIHAPPRIGVDVIGEERVKKCMNCYEQLSAIRSFILKRQTMQGKLGQSFRELLSMLCTEFN